MRVLALKVMLHLNQDHQVVSEIMKLEHEMCFSELSKTRMKRWDETVGDPRPWRRSGPSASLLQIVFV